MRYGSALSRLSRFISLYILSHTLFIFGAPTVGQWLDFLADPIASLISGHEYIVVGALAYGGAGLLVARRFLRMDAVHYSDFPEDRWTGVCRACIVFFAVFAAPAYFVVPFTTTGPLYEVSNPVLTSAIAIGSAAAIPGGWYIARWTVDRAGYYWKAAAGSIGGVFVALQIATLPLLLLQFPLQWAVAYSIRGLTTSLTLVATIVPYVKNFQENGPPVSGEPILSLGRDHVFYRHLRESRLVGILATAAFSIGSGLLVVLSTLRSSPLIGDSLEPVLFPTYLLGVYLGAFRDPILALLVLIVGPVFLLLIINIKKWASM